MKYSTLIEDMIAEGATPEMILVAVRAVERQETDALERRRAADRARQDRHRSRDVTLSNVSHGLSRSHAGAEDRNSTSEIEPLKEVSVAKRAFRLAEDWTLPVDWRQDALNAGLREPLIDLEAAKLRDWSRSSKNGAKLDWRAAWRNWCREAAARQPAARAGPTAAPMKDSVANAAQRRLEELRNGRSNGSGIDDHQQVAGLISGHSIRLVG